MPCLEDAVDSLLGPIHVTCGQPVEVRARVIAYPPFEVFEPYCEHCQVVINLVNVQGRLPDRHWSLGQLM